jgi:hypothetical protein
MTFSLLQASISSVSGVLDKCDFPRVLGQNIQWIVIALYVDNDNLAILYHFAHMMPLDVDMLRSLALDCLHAK